MSKENRTHEYFLRAAKVWEKYFKDAKWAERENELKALRAELLPARKPS